jgi:hypothetical protein
MNRLAASIAGGTLVGAVALFVLGLIGYAAGSAAGLSLSFHSGISALWIFIIGAVVIGSAIASSWSAAYFYKRPSRSAPIWASIVLAAIIVFPFLRGTSPRLVWLGVGAAFVFALVSGIIVASMTRAASPAGLPLKARKDG